MKLSKLKAYLLLAVFSIILQTSGTLGMGIIRNYDCSESSEAVTYARSLSKERLEKLYYDMERLSTDPSMPTSGYCKIELKNGESFPEPFSDLEVDEIRPADGRIMLEGCFDHFVIMFFEGFEHRGRIEAERRIVLVWGEFEPDAGSQVLWKEE